MQIPVTVKMRAGWDAHEINAPELARRMEDAGAAAVAVHGRTAAQSYSGVSDWDLIAQRRGRASAFRCSAAATASSRSSCVERLRDAARRGVLVGRGALRNPWIFEQAAALPRAGRPRDDHHAPSAGSSCSTTSTCC